MTFFSFFLPRRYCICCNHPLQDKEEHICASCFSEIPLTNIKGEKENILEKVFWHTIPIRRASSLFFYRLNDNSHKILIELKYHNQHKVGIFFGKIVASNLKNTDFFKGIDYIVPIPLSNDKLRKRGYNQSEEIAKGVAEIQQIPLLLNLVERTISNPTQTKKSREDRLLNVEGIFSAKNIGNFKEKHILLIDDVITTGSTVISCAKAILAKYPSTTFSVLSLAISTSITSVPFYRHKEIGDEDESFGEIKLKSPLSS